VLDVNGVARELELGKRVERAKADTMYLNAGVLAPKEIFRGRARKRLRRWDEARFYLPDDEAPRGQRRVHGLPEHFSRSAVNECVMCRVGFECVPLRVIVPLTRRGEIRAAARRRRRTRGRR
jgi:hypothetical protein